jgi:hypothetical protein
MEQKHGYETRAKDHNIRFFSKILRTNDFSIVSQLRMLAGNIV